MVDWDDDDFDDDFEVSTKTAPTALKGKWEGEDEGDEDVPDEWDAESEEEQPKPVAVAPLSKPKRSVKQAIADREERERIAAAEKAARRDQGLDLSDADEDPQTRRRRERDAELAADLEVAQQLLSTTKLAPANGEPSIDITTFKPKTKEDFDRFQKNLIEIITSASNLPHYAMFVAGLAKAIAAPLDSEDVKKVASGLTALGNEKLKSEKGSKLKKGKKPALVVGTGKSTAPKFDTRNYDDDDDFDDFMA